MGYSNETETYIRSVKDAVKKIAPQYFRVPTTYRPTGIVRERVFCYELYHWLRLQSEDFGAITVHGEIDKRGHPDFERQDRRNPDFVFHKPGTHDNNTLVIEVKGQIDASGIKKDLVTLLKFVTEYSYQIGIFILYNHCLRELHDRMSQELDRLQKKYGADKIIILAVKSAYQAPEECLLSQFVYLDLP